MKLSSGLNRELPGHFVLDEDGLRRIVGVLQTKASFLAINSAIVFVVNREDDRFYETINISDVLSDPNTAGHLIRSLSIELRIEDPLISAHPWSKNWLARAVYSSSRKDIIQINVNSDDRTWALLLADELEPQVRRTRSSERISTLLLILFFAAVGVLAGTIAKSFLPAFGLTDKAIELTVYGIGVVTVLVVMSTLEDRPSWMIHFAGPQSAFNWGERTRVYNSSMERQKNFFWVVIVGLLVSVLSTVYTNYVIPSAPTQLKTPGTPASAPSEETHR